MIGFLRFVGVINAAIWLGGAVFFSFGAAPAFFSPDMAAALGVDANNFNFFAGKIAQVVLASYFHFHVTCAVIAWLHLLAEWLYLGRPSRKFAFGLLASLFAITLVGGVGLQPRLKELQKIRYTSPQAAEREQAAQSFRTWHALAQVLNLVMIGGLVVYVWRTSNPTNTPRFISSVKFRG